MNKLSVVPRILSLPGGSLVNETFRNNSDCIMKPIRISGSPPGWEVDEKVRHFVVGQEKQNSKNGCSWQFIIILLQLFDSFYSIHNCFLHRSDIVSFCMILAILGSFLAVLALFGQHFQMLWQFLSALTQFSEY